MNKTLLLTVSMVMASVFSGSAFAADLETATLVTPAPAPAEPVFGQYVRDAVRERSPQDRSMTAWKLSLAPLAASQFLDAYSSRGLHELNPVLAGSNGQFGTKATLLKVGIVGALAGVEYLVIRNHPAAAKAFWKVNLISAAVTGGMAAHNFTQH